MFVSFSVPDQTLESTSVRMADLNVCLATMSWTFMKYLTLTLNSPLVVFACISLLCLEYKHRFNHTSPTFGLIIKKTVFFSGTSNVSAAVAFSCGLASWWFAK